MALCHWVIGTCRFWSMQCFKTLRIDHLEMRYYIAEEQRPELSHLSVMLLSGLVNLVLNSLSLDNFILYYRQVYLARASQKNKSPFIFRCLYILQWSTFPYIAVRSKLHPFENYIEGRSKNLNLFLPTRKICFLVLRMFQMHFYLCWVSGMLICAWLHPYNN